MKVCDEIARWLEEKGITHAFGIIGGGNVALWDAIARRAATRLITTHHEQAASMASAYFNRVAGRLGSIALVTTGAGSTNAITGVMAAHMDGIPLLVISGNEALKYFKLEDHLRIQGVQGYWSAEVARHMTKESGMFAALPNIPLFLNKWHESATTAPCGAVWADFPKDVQNASL